MIYGKIANLPHLLVENNNFTPKIMILHTKSKCYQNLFFSFIQLEKFKTQQNYVNYTLVESYT